MSTHVILESLLSRNKMTHNQSSNELEPEKDFIITFGLLPILWDRSDKHYVNKYKRNEALEKLLVIYKKVKPLATVEDVKRKINVLRSNYRREMRKIIQSQRSGINPEEVYTPRSWTFDYLRFLDKLETQDGAYEENTNNSDGYKPELTIYQPQAQQKMEYQEPSYSTNTTSSLVNTPSVSYLNTTLPPPSNYTTTRKNPVAKRNELLEMALPEPGASSSNLIAFDWVETLDRLDPVQRLYAKKAINDILFEAELGNLNRYSVQINKPAPSHDYTHASSPDLSQNDEYSDILEPEFKFIPTSDSLSFDAQDN